MTSQINSGDTISVMTDFILILLTDFLLKEGYFLHGGANESCLVFCRNQGSRANRTDVFTNIWFSHKVKGTPPIKIENFLSFKITKFLH